MKYYAYYEYYRCCFIGLVTIMYKQRNICTISFVNILYLLVLCFCLIYVTLYFNTLPRNLQLKQILILSRHNVRTPLSKNLANITPNKWPKWKETIGHLTAKGFQLEGFIGAYLADYLRYSKLINNVCPSEEEFFIHASSKERTISSAKAFIQKGFPNCNITIHHTNINESDPIFSPFIHNSSDIFKKIALREMNQVVNKLHLNRSYEELESILNYKESDLCKVEHRCDMTTDKIKINIIVNNKPKVSGPLKISNEAIDGFLMAYYNGFSSEDIAWGKLSTLDQWDNILSINKGYHDVIFNTSHVAKDIAYPLIKYMINMFSSKRKIVLLMGHDANINVILNSLKVNHFMLKNSFSQTPVGGKLVFQKWYDVDNNIYLMKVDFVYQSSTQLRNSEVLSLENPPQVQSLELNECTVDNNGYCSWDEFMAFLKKL